MEPSATRTANSGSGTGKAMSHEQIRALLKQAWDLRLRDPQKCLQLSLDANRLARDNAYPEGLAMSYRNIGFAMVVKGDLENALKHLQMALRLFVKIRDRHGEGTTQIAMGHGYLRTGEYAESITAITRAFNIFEDEGNKRGVAYAELSTGRTNLELANLDQALKHFQNAENLFVQLGDPEGEALAKDGCGCVYRMRGSYGRALEYHMPALALFEQTEVLYGQAETLNNIGLVYQKLEDFERALEYFYKGLKIYDTLEDRFNEAAALIDIGALFLQQEHVDEAFVVLFKALDQAKDIRARPKVYLAHKYISEAYARTGNYEKAWEHHVEYHELREAVVSDEARGKLRNQQIAFATEKTKSEAEIYRLRNIELATTNQELERALELTNDSIAYARRIQEAMLPGEKTVKQLLPDAFVYFKPRDVVSGDFYWITEWNDRIILAAVDCTGHGVPGAFMSVLGQSLLNQVVKENYTFIPAKILQAMDQRLVEELSQQDGSNDVLDGMEAAVVSISLEDYTLQYAGANIPLYVVNENGMTTVPAKHAALGGTRRINEVKEFQNHVVPIKQGDVIYLFSDGFRDQFGVEDATKLKYSTKRFQNLLLQIYQEPMQRQKEILAQEFDTWKGKLKQLDDVMVIGVRF